MPHQKEPTPSAKNLTLARPAVRTAAAELKAWTRSLNANDAPPVDAARGPGPDAEPDFVGEYLALVEEGVTPDIDAYLDLVPEAHREEYRERIIDALAEREGRPRRPRTRVRTAAAELKQWARNPLPQRRPPPPIDPLDTSVTGISHLCEYERLLDAGWVPDLAEFLARVPAELRRETEVRIHSMLRARGLTAGAPAGGAPTADGFVAEYARLLDEGWRPAVDEFLARVPREHRELVEARISKLFEEAEAAETDAKAAPETPSTDGIEVCEEQEQDAGDAPADAIAPEAEPEAAPDVEPEQEPEQEPDAGEESPDDDVSDDDESDDDLEETVADEITVSPDFLAAGMLFALEVSDDGEAADGIADPSDDADDADEDDDVASELDDAFASFGAAGFASDDAGDTASDDTDGFEWDGSGESDETDEFPADEGNSGAFDPPLSSVPRFARPEPDPSQRTFALPVPTSVSRIVRDEQPPAPAPRPAPARPTSQPAPTSASRIVRPSSLHPTPSGRAAAAPAPARRKPKFARPRAASLPEPSSASRIVRPSALPAAPAQPAHAERPAAAAKARPAAKAKPAAKAEARRSAQVAPAPFAWDEPASAAGHNRHEPAPAADHVQEKPKPKQKAKQKRKHKVAPNVSRPPAPKLRRPAGLPAPDEDSVSVLSPRAHSHVDGFRREHDLGPRTFVAWDESRSRWAVVRKLPSGTADTVQRLVLNEAMRADALQDPTLVTYDAAAAGTLISEYVEGRSIDALASQLLFGRSADVLRMVAGALARAHDEGVLHLRLTPRRILVTPSRHARLLGFGLAAAGVPRTDPFAAPEQLDGGEVWKPADVFSFGAVMYSVLAERPPFTGDTTDELRSAMKHRPTFPRQLDPEVPSDLQAICLTCLERDPNLRPTMQEVAEDLERIVRGEPALLRPRVYGEIARADLRRRRQELAMRQSQGLMTSDECDAVEAVYRRLHDREEHWSFEGLRASPRRTAVYAGVTLTAASLAAFAWAGGVSVLPILLVAGLVAFGEWARRGRQPSVGSAFLAAASLALVPALCSLHVPFAAAAFVATAASAAALWRMRLAVLSWTTTALGAATLAGVVALIGLPSVVAAVLLAGLIPLARYVPRPDWELPVRWLGFAAALGAPLLLAGQLPSYGFSFLEPWSAVLAVHGIALLCTEMVLKNASTLALRRAARLLEVAGVALLLGGLFHNAQVLGNTLSVLLYALAPATLLSCSPWRRRPVFLLAGLAGLVGACYLPVAHGLVPAGAFATIVGGLGAVVAGSLFGVTLRH